MLDVVEHLTADELATALSEARRLLRPGGRLLIHTLPNRTIYAVTYRLQRLAWPPRWRAWPRDPRNEHERLMHVGEQTVGSLRRALKRAGFPAPRVWVGDIVYDAFVPPGRARTTYHRLARRRLTRRLGGADIWAIARAP
jgi:SAM-dependent methyltransferase